MQLIVQPTGPLNLGDWLNSSFTAEWTSFRAAVAFVKRSGVRHIGPALKAFARDNTVEIVAGIDHQGTSYEGLSDLQSAVSPNGRIVIVHNRLPHTFHPKVFLFRSLCEAELVIGSGNLTQGGLYTNYEVGLRIHLNLANAMQSELLKGIEYTLDHWAQQSNSVSQELTNDVLDVLRKSGTVLHESEISSTRTLPSETAAQRSLGLAYDLVKYFGAVPFNPAPETDDISHNREGIGVRTYDFFVMTLQQTDVGVGQTTPGTSQRSPEVFVPLGARDHCPEFWNWPYGFQEDPQRAGKLDRKNVRVRINGRMETVQMMTWPAKHDFRLRNRTLRDTGSVGDILRIERVKNDTAAYEAWVIKPSDPSFNEMLSRCDKPVKNSRKRFGYY